MYTSLNYNKRSTFFKCKVDGCIFTDFVGIDTLIIQTL